MRDINMLPACIDNTNFKYVKVDDKYIASIIINSFPKEIDFLQIIEDIPKEYNYDMSIYIKKQDTLKTLKELTYQISSTATELKTSTTNQIDIDIISKSKEESQKLRYDIQINNEEVYKTTLILTFYSKNKSDLQLILKSFQGKLYSKNLVSNIINFRHIDGYILSIPIGDFQNKLINDNYNVFTTSSLANFFPFHTKTIFDRNGVLFGFTLQENRICCIDIFNSNNLNANMCIFGSSGSGKSYFAKLMVIRNFLMGRKQYIFDPESEYINIVKNLNGYVLYLCKDTKCYYNILDINEYDIYLYGDNFLEIKIFDTIKVITKLIPDITTNEQTTLKISLQKLYKTYGITNESESMYVAKEGNRVFIEKKIKNSSYFPTICELKTVINNKKLWYKLEKNIIQKFPFLTRQTNINIYSSLVVFDVSNRQNGSNVFIEFFLNCIERYLKYTKYKERKNIYTIIYMDEIWRFICYKTDNIAHVIYDKFKTIRKLNAGMVAITQDINDFFLIQNGDYGKGILNNCNFKLFFKLDYEDTNILYKLSILNKEILDKIKLLNKGKALLAFNKDYTVLKIEANNYEEKLVKEVIFEDTSCGK